MSGYRRNSDWAWEDAAASGMVSLALVITVIIIAVIVTIVIVLVKELFRIYRTWAGTATRTAQTLWVALASLLGAWLIAGLLLLNPATGTGGAYLASWSFLAFVVIVEISDWHARQHLLALPASPDLTLPDVLGPWLAERAVA